MGGLSRQQIFIELFERHESALKRYIFSLVYCYADAEDIYQETLYEAFRAFEQLRDRDLFGAWVKKIARGLICKRFKKKKFELVSLEGTVAQRGEGALPVSEQTVEEEIFTEFEKINVRKWVEKLSYRERVFFHYYYQEERGMEEIAEILDVKVGALWALHSRMKEKLRKEAAQDE